MRVFSVCYYHIIWATKHRQPLITPQIESVILATAQQKSLQLKSHIEAMNTVADHLHVAVKIPPSLAISTWVQDVKGLTAYEVNRAYPNLDITFRWQRGYSVLSFGKRNLPFVVQYIEQQKEHHEQNTLEQYLEHLENE